MGRRATVVGLATVFAALALATSAPADITGECAVRGTAHTNPPVQLVGGQGTYQFEDLTLLCTGVEDGLNPVSVVLNLSSSGTYESAVCGTGSAHSTSIAVNSVNLLFGSSTTDWQALVSNLGYDVDFVAGQGVMTWHEPDGTEDHGGVVTLTASSTGDPPSPPSCVTSLDVTGSAIRAPIGWACFNTPERPAKATVEGVKMIEARNRFGCEAARRAMTACARLERKDPATGKWVPVGAEACNTDFGESTSSPTAVARVPCVNGEYRTVARGFAIGASNKVTETTNPPESINCGKG